jgi:hypothetical protein
MRIISLAEFCAVLLFSSSIAMSGESQQKSQDPVQALKQLQQQRATDFRSTFIEHADASSEEKHRLIAEFQARQKDSLRLVREKIESMKNAQPPPPLAIVRKIEIPDWAGPEYEEFLVQRAELHNQRAVLFDSLRNRSVGERGSAFEEWQKQNRDAIAGIRVQIAKAAQEAQSSGAATQLEIKTTIEAAVEWRFTLAERRAFVASQLEIVKRVQEEKKRADQEQIAKPLAK